MNLSGSSGNPFSNTSWTPAAASNTSRTVIDAQAEREKRHQERQRIKAAGKIQQTWRGHKSRRELAEDRRAAFDEVYTGHAAQTWGPSQRVILASSLLVFFFDKQRGDDVKRVVRFVQDALSAGMEPLVPPRATAARTNQLLGVFVKSLQAVASSSRLVNYILFYADDNLLTSPTRSAPDMRELFNILSRLLQRVPRAASGILGPYYDAIEHLCKSDSHHTDMLELIKLGLLMPLGLPDGNRESTLHMA